MTSMMLMASLLASAVMNSAVETFEQHSHSRATLRLNSTTLHCSGELFEVWPTPAHVVVSAMLRLEVVSICRTRKAIERMRTEKLCM